MVKVINWAVEASKGEQHVVNSVCVNTASYVRQLKTVLGFLVALGMMSMLNFIVMFLEQKRKLLQ